MEQLKDLIDRLGKALRITTKTDPPAESTSTNDLGPIHGPVRDPR
jgi:hypothetical protein